MISFDNFPAVYWCLGYILTGLVIAAGFYNKIPNRVFVILGISLLIYMRMPAVVLNRELNIDESQMLSHAITLYQDPVYWRSVDGTTIGPLDNYLLVIPRLLGYQIDYTSGRVMGLFCAIGAMFFLFLTMRRWFGQVVARQMWLPGLIFLSFTQELDFVHYSSEQLPVLLLSLCLWLLSRISGGTFKWTDTFWLGLTAGAIPFAKLQAVPLVAVVVLTASWCCFQLYREKARYLPLLTLFLGGLSFPLLVFSWAYTQHVLSDLVDFYLLGNVIYAGENNFLSIPSQFFKLVSLSQDFTVFTLISAFSVLIGIVQWFILRKEADTKERRMILITSVTLILACLYSVTKSGNYFIHYLNFCIIPWSIMAANRPPKRFWIAVTLPLFMVIWFLRNDYISFRKVRSLNNFVSTEATQLPESAVVKELKKYTQKGDYMVVWGWQCTYYVEAQLAQGTAENHSERSIFQHPMKEIYRKRYLSDMKRTKPVVFIDAVGRNSLWVQDKKNQSADSYPELAQYLHEHYILKGTIDDNLLYIRNDRAGR